MKIGTRKSPLALAQAEEVRLKLLAAWPDLVVELVPMTTSGDQFLGQPLAEIGGKGLFTKELDEALVDERIDIAVHSMKDMPTILPEGTEIGAVLEREDPRDMLIGAGINSIADIPKGAKLGTSSLRRASQMLALRPDLTVVPLRGNVQTRLNKLEQGEAHCTMLAMAGLNRLKLSNLPGVILPVDMFIPAIAQGAIAIQCRSNDNQTSERLIPLNHTDTQIATACERAFLRKLDGSCRTPIAGYAQIQGITLNFNGLIAEPDGSNVRRISKSGSVKDAEQIGTQAAEALLPK